MLCEKEGQTLVVSAAGAVLCEGSTQWRQGALAQRLTLPQAGLPIRLHEDLAVTAWYCPASGDLLAVDVHGKSEAVRHDVLLSF